MISCPNCELQSIRRFGYFKNCNGPVQRYRCRQCGKTFSTERKMNRINDDRLGAILKYLSAGNSIRGTAVLTGTHKNTVCHIAKQHGIKMQKRSGKWPKRNRRDYWAKLGKDYKVTQYQRLQLRERVHGQIALWLAKNPKPQSLDQIYSAISFQFSWLKKQSLLYMLRKNSWGCYRRVGKKFTYRPPEWYFPSFGFRVGRPTRYPEMEAAKAIYCQRTGTPDPLTDNTIEKLKRDNEAFVRETQAEAIRRAAPQLQLMATATEIARHYEKHGN